ncbi:MAG: hypothetical protein ACE5J2_07935 [Nitrososphaerales archaeon]
MENLEQELVNKTTNLLSILSKKDALTIFLLAKDGLEAETDTPQRIGLTRKQYYTRLKQLVDSGLIDKVSDIYYHTTLGTLVHERHLMALLEHVKNIRKMRMADALKRTKQFSTEDIGDILGKVTGVTQSEVVQGSSVIKMVSNYEEVISMFMQGIEFAEKEILLASRFTNDLIINAMIRRANAGLEVKVIADTDLVRQFMKSASDNLQVIDNAMERAEVAGNPWHPWGSVKRRFTDIPFSFAVIDGREIGIELVDSNDPQSFKAAVFTTNEGICHDLRVLYESLWNRSSEDVTKLVQGNFIADLKSSL